MNSPAPSTFDDIEHVWISMPDGVRLAARLWLPHGAADAPVPAIFEIIPYRKRDMVRARDERNHPFLASHGYACLRVDMRGSGDSEGLMADMYAPDELADTRHVISWIAQQPWCNGRVGMFGTSWGGTASLQASANAPDALKAVIAVCATQDRYEDDIHHMGGCLLTDSIEWGATLPAILASPPSAETVGDTWRRMWEERLEHLAFPLEAWVREEARGTYWRTGSVRFEASAITCPILGVGGWSDRYSNSVMPMVQARPDKVWGIVGPWSHHYPDVGHPGPALDFQQIALQWWDHWLKGSAEDTLAWPKLQVWMREYDPPVDALDLRNGRWVQSNQPEAQAHLQFALTNGQLLRPEHAGQERAELIVPHDLQVGQQSGDTGYFGRYGGLPLEQSADDAGALVYETAALDEEVALFGAAELSLNVTSTTPVAQLSVRINDVAPDGTVCRVVMTVRNLALDHALDERTGDTSGCQRVQIRFPTNAYRFKLGHKIRLAFAASYWPLVWPAPEVGELRLSEAGASLMLPLFEGSLEDACCDLPEPASPPDASRFTSLEAGALRRTMEAQDDGTLISTWHQAPVRARHHDTNTIFGFETKASHSIDRADPLSAQSCFDHMLEYQRPDGTARIESWADVRCDAEWFHVSGQVTAFWNDEQVFVRSWTPRIKRRCS